MRKLSHLAALARALFGGIATEGNQGRRTAPLSSVEVWCRASTLVLLRERGADR